MMRPGLILATLLICSPVLWAQADLNVLREEGGKSPRRMLREYLLAETGKAFQQRRDAVNGLKTPDDVRKRQREVLAAFRLALGDLPERTPLRARVVGVEQRAGYRVERVVYESRPGHHVTASLYLPDGKGPFPGMLMPIGHSATGKAAEYVQRGAILLALNRMAVLAYDPIGQGERRQLLDGQGKPLIAGSTTEHTLIGVGALLVGRTTAGYRVWDGVRSLDYLLSRPEIDGTRIGCTGCSGGGTLTSYLMALDERITAAAPSCYLTTLERLFATIGPQDAEQNLTGQVALGIEHADYITVRGPRPTLICAATRDFFDIQGTWTTFREAKRVYGLLGRPECVEMIESNTAHGYPREHREAALRWLSRWLLGVDRPLTEPDFPIAKEPDLFCTRTGQVLEEFKGVSAFDLNRQRAIGLAAARRESGAKSPGDLRAAVRRRLALPPTIAAAGHESKGSANGITRRVFTTEAGIMVPALLFEPEKVGEDTPLTVVVHGEGKAAVARMGDYLGEQRRAGRRVLALDLRGMGETAPGVPQAGRPNYFGSEYQEIFLSLHLNRPLLGQRVFDLLSVIATVAPREPEKLELVGIGSGVPIVLHAATLDTRIGSVVLQEGIPSWKAVASTPVTLNQLANVVPGALADYDLPDLAAGLAPRPLRVNKPVDPAGKPLAPEAAAEEFAALRSAYSDKGAFDHLTLQSSQPAPDKP